MFSVCIYNVYRPYLHDHFVITSITCGWQKGGKDWMLCSRLVVVKRYKEYNKDFLYTEVKVRYEKKSDSLHLLLFYTSCLWKPGLTVSPCGHWLRSLTLFSTCCNSWKVHLGEAKGLQESGSWYATTIKPAVNFVYESCSLHQVNNSVHEKPHCP